MTSSWGAPRWLGFAWMVLGLCSIPCRTFAQTDVPPVPQERAASETASPAQPRPTEVQLHVAPAEPSAANRRGLGFLAAAGLHTGLGLGARLGLGDIGLEVTGGYQVLFALWHPRDDSAATHVSAGSSAQFGSELYFTPWHPSERSAIGVKAGYRYNSVLEHGLGVAITFLGTLSSHLAVEGLAGAQVFPGARARLLRKLDIPQGADLSYRSDQQWFEYGLELIWYP